MIKEIVLHSSFFGALLSLGAFEFGIFLKRRFKKPIFNPLVVSIIITIFVLTILGITYEEYHPSAVHLSYLLTPATVCLAVPLYEQLELLKNNYQAIAAGLIAGILSGFVCIYLLSLLFGLDHALYASLLPKSVTTAIGMGISKENGGVVTISVAAIIATGAVGSMLSDILFKIFKITNAVAQGLALGCSSHAMGTARAIEMGEAQGAMASLAIAVSGLLSVVGVSFFAKLI